MMSQPDHLDHGYRANNGRSQKSSCTLLSLHSKRELMRRIRVG
ncbi:Uncharacterised protein [Halioglobus japonicus]|nr:Uncharacterised protein [Halioglobus japonicus]